MKPLLAIKNPGLALVAALAIVMATTTLAADAPVVPAPTAQPAPVGEVMDELEEVVVRGKNLSHEIDEAENKFFSLFNDLNKDDRYDTHCVQLQMTTGSRIQTRACIPGFVADAMAAWAPFKARCQPPEEPDHGPYGVDFTCLDKNGNGRLSMEEASARDELGAVFMEIAGEDASISGAEFQDAMDTRADLSAPAVYQPPPPQLVLMDGSDKWYQHMLKVTNSDPRLKTMADELGGLYHQLAATSRQYEKLDAEIKASKATGAKGGPRAR